MSKRRAFGDVVQKDDGDGEPPYLTETDHSGIRHSGRGRG